MRNRLLETGRAFVRRADEIMTRLRLPLGAGLALLLAALTLLMNVGGGPLGNLNDIGGWRNRLLFLLMAAGVQAALLLGCTLLHRGSFSRLALRQVILTAGLLIALMPINQKSYVYVEQIQPVVRLMDEGGLAAGLAAETTLSAPALTLLYALTRMPVYDMYMVKLLAVGSFLLTALLAMRAADRRGWGIRTEVLLTLLMILPQAFLNAGCAPQIETLAVLLLALSATALDGERPHPFASALCFGGAVAVSGVALYALPLYGLLIAKKRMKGRHLAAAGLLVLVCLLPAVCAGMAPGAALSSLVRASFSLPAYAAGSPSLLSIFPRANPLETPDAFMLKQMESIDLGSNGQYFYTQVHFERLLRGMSIAALAAYAGLCALGVRKKGISPLRRALTLTLAALACCPAASMGAWLALDVLCVMAIVREPELRLPACLLLFATAGASCYPLTEETLLPVAAAWALCVVSLCMLYDVIPMGRAAARKEAL